jgi:hypothetical protein
MRSLLFVVALVAFPACDLYFPNHQVEVEGTVRDEAGTTVEGALVSFRRSRLLYDTPLAETETDASGAYRLTYWLDGCSGLFDHFSVVAERVVGADTTRAGEPVDCADGVQTVDLVIADAAP